MKKNFFEKKSEFKCDRILNRRNFCERNFREFREFWPFSRKFIPRKFSKWQFAKVYSVKFF